MVERVKLKSLVAVFEYSDGTTKTSNIDVEQNEALFWSENAVRGILAPYYAGPRTYSVEDLQEFNEANGIQAGSITPDVVMQLWDTSVDGSEAGDRPTAIQKVRRSFPVVACKRWCF